MTVLTPLPKPDYARRAAVQANTDQLMADVAATGLFRPLAMTRTGEFPPPNVWARCRHRLILFHRSPQVASIEGLAANMTLALLLDGSERNAIAPAVMQAILDEIDADKAVLILASTGAVLAHAQAQINAMGGWVAGGTA